MKEKKQQRGSKSDKDGQLYWSAWGDGLLFHNAVLHIGPITKVYIKPCGWDYFVTNQKCMNGKEFFSLEQTLQLELG